MPTIRPERAILSGRLGLSPRSRVRLQIRALQRVQNWPAFRALVPAWRYGGAGGRPVIDQAEELLNEDGRSEAERFLEFLARTLELEKRLAIRSDAFRQFQALKALAAVAREPFDLTPMPEGSLRLVIEGPAKFAKPPLKFEAALVGDVIVKSQRQARRQHTSEAVAAIKDGRISLNGSPATRSQPCRTWCNATAAITAYRRTHGRSLI
jgi:hypothetical protein